MHHLAQPSASASQSYNARHNTVRSYRSHISEEYSHFTYIGRLIVQHTNLYLFTSKLHVYISMSHDQSSQPFPCLDVVYKLGRRTLDTK